MRTLLVLISSCLCVALLSMADPPVPQNSGCRCLFSFSTFPATFVVNSVEQGTLTETLSCSSTTNDCSITGNITWTAAIACYTSGVNGPWSTTYSYSIDSINSVFQYFTTCTGSHSNVHQGTTSSCTSSGTQIAATGEIRNFNNVNIGTAAKGWFCTL